MLRFLIVSGLIVASSLLTVFLNVSDSADAQTIFPAGSEAKATGMESSQTTMSAPAILYNPANLSKSPGYYDNYLELGFAQVTQSYEHPDFDQVRVRVRSPILAIGGVTRPYFDFLRAGFMIFPAKRGKQSIPGLPRRVGDTEVPLDVSNEEDLIKAGVGLSYLSPIGLAVGASMIYSYEHRKVDAKTINSNKSIITLDAKGNFFKPLFGLRYEWEWLSTSLTYMPRLKKSYQGTQKASFATKKSSPRVTEYEPVVWGFGLGAAFKPVEANLSLNHARWQGGNRVLQEGLTSRTKKSDLHHITEKGLQIRYHILEALSASLAYADLPSPWGEGRFTGELSEEVLGVDFARSNHIDRKAVALGAVYQFVNRYKTNLTLTRTWGEREVSKDGNRPGFYQTEVFIISTGLTASF